MKENKEADKHAALRKAIEDNLASLSNINTAAKEVEKENKNDALQDAVFEQSAYNIINLLETKADINAKDDYGFSVIHLAAQEGNVDIVKILFDNGADIESKSSNKDTPLHLAAQNNHCEVIEFLVVNAKADLNSQDSEGWTPLHCAAYNGNVEATKSLLDLGAEIKSIDYHGVPGQIINEATPIHFAALNGHHKVIQTFIEHGINLKSKEFDQLLHLAATNLQVETFEMLVNNGLNIESQTSSGETVLHISCQGGNRHGRRFSTESEVEEKIDNGYIKILNKILSHSKKILEIPEKSGWMPLHIAAFYGHKSIVEFLIKNGAEIDSTNKDLNTPLSIAAEANNSKAVKSLVEAGANVNHKNCDDKTPLEMACSSLSFLKTPKDRLETIKILIADTNIDQNILSKIDIEEDGAQELEEYLRERVNTPSTSPNEARIRYLLPTPERY